MVGYAINIFSQAAATYRKEAVVLHMFRDVDKILWILSLGGDIKFSLRVKNLPLFGSIVKMTHSTVGLRRATSKSCFDKHLMRVPWDFLF